MRGSFHLLVGVMLWCLLPFFITITITSEVPEAPSALSGTDDYVGDDAHLPDGIYLTMSADVVQEVGKRPVNAPLLLQLVLTTTFGASVLWLLTTNARKRGAVCACGVEEDRPWLAATHEAVPFLGVFLL
jgi:CDGSH-type Zn-finger protein